MKNNRETAPQTAEEAAARASREAALEDASEAAAFDAEAETETDETETEAEADKLENEAKADKLENEAKAEPEADKPEGEAEADKPEDDEAKDEAEANEAEDNEAETEETEAEAEEKARRKAKRKKRRSVFFIVLLVLLLLAAAGAAAAGGYVLYRLDCLEAARQQADDYKARGEYAQALDAYALLMEDDYLSFTPFTNAYVCAGADGVTACADALLETSEGAHYLAEHQTLQNALSHATHPAVPASLEPSLERRSLLCEAILAEEAGDLLKALDLLNRSGLRRELSYPIESTLAEQTAISEALRAREEGRYQDAIDILTRSILEPELVAELRQQIIDEQDARVLAQAKLALDSMDLETAVRTLHGLSREEDRIALEKEFRETWSNAMNSLHEKYADRIHAGAWYSLIRGETAQLSGDRRFEGLDLAAFAEGRTVGGVFSLLQLNNGRVQLLGDTLGAEAAAKAIVDAKDAALGMNHGLILHEDGTVTNLGAKQYGRAAVTEWTDMVKVAAGGFHSLGLRADGTVAAAGLDLDGQCQVASWTDVVAVAAGLRHSVALTKDGRVLATGDNSYGQCNVSQWENIIDIRCGGNFTLGLTADWRLLAVGDNSCGQCDVSQWPEVIAFDGGLWHTVALLSNGHIVTVGANDHDQRALDGTVLFASQRQLEQPAETVFCSEPELLYTGHPTDGPWLYLNGEGCVIIAFDADAGKIKPTRADLICTFGHPPVGILSGGGDRPGIAVHAAKLARQNKAVFAITGDYFSFGYNADGLQIRRGIVFKEDKEEVGFGFYPDGSMRIIDPEATTSDDLLSIGVRDSWVFGPTLILNGEALDISYHPLSFNDVTMRTVVGSLCPYHHVAVAYGSSTLAQVVENLLDYGCDIAYNLDGGRSCWMIFMGNIVNRTIYVNKGWRGLQDMVGFLTSDMVPNP